MYICKFHHVLLATLCNLNTVKIFTILILKIVPQCSNYSVFCIPFGITIHQWQIKNETTVPNDFTMILRVLLVTTISCNWFFASAQIILKGKCPHVPQFKDFDINRVGKLFLAKLYKLFKDFPKKSSRHVPHCRLKRPPFFSTPGNGMNSAESTWPTRRWRDAGVEIIVSVRTETFPSTSTLSSTSKWFRMSKIRPY